MLTAHCGPASVPTSLNNYKKCPILSNHQVTKHNPRSFRTICKAKGDDKKGKGAPKGPGDGKDAARKADFSAYWSLKVREWFSSRRGYLDGAEATPVDLNKPPEWLAKLEEAAKEARAELDEAIEAKHAERMEHAATSAESGKVLSMLEKAMSKPGAPPMRKMSPMEQVEMDAQMARAYLWVQGACARCRPCDVAAALKLPWVFSVELHAFKIHCPAHQGVAALTVGACLWLRAGTRRK